MKKPLKGKIEGASLVGFLMLVSTVVGWLVGQVEVYWAIIQAIAGGTFFSMRFASDAREE